MRGGFFVCRVKQKKEHDGYDACTSLALPSGIDDGETRYRLHRRFDRVPGRLVGDEKNGASVCLCVLVIGVGGVGSFAAESLLRSGIGQLRWSILIGLRDNTSRQLQTMRGTVGKLKAQVLAEGWRCESQAKGFVINRFT